MSVSSGPCSGGGQITSSGSSAITDCFTDVGAVDGSSSVPTTFQPGTVSGVSFTGNPSASNTVDLSSESTTHFTSLTVAMSVSSGPCSGGGQVSGTGSSTIADCFTGVASVNGSSSVPTTFQPGSANGVTFAGGGSGLTNTLDLSQEGGSAANLTVSMNGDSQSNPGSLTGTGSAGGSISDTLSGIQLTLGSPNGTTFQPGTAGGLTFNGDPTASTTLDLTSEGAGAQVSPERDSAAQPGTIVLGTSSDAFTGVTRINGASAGSTTFISGTGSTLIDFLGQGSGNKLDLSGTPSTSSTPAVVDAEPESGQGTVSTTNEPATFSGIQSFVGPSAGNTTFITGNAGGLTFTGQGNSNTLSFQDGSSSGSVQISFAPNSQGHETAQPGTGTDTFTDLTTIVGSPGNDTFVGGPGTYTIQGGGGHDTLTEASASNPVSVSISSGQATATGGYTGTITSTGVGTFVGSAGGGNSFAAGADGGYTFEASGGSPGNTLDLSGAPSGTTADAGGGSVHGLSSGIGGATSDSFSSITTFVGSASGNTTFKAAAGGGYTFNGQGSGNTLDLSAAPSGASIDIGGGSVHGLSSGIGGATSDSFSGITTFVGSASGNTTFKAAAGGGYTFNGQGSGNTLDLSAAPAGASIDVVGGSVHALSSGIGGATSDSFSSMTTFVGSASGNTTFKAAAGGGYTFNGQGLGNTLDLSAAPSGASVNLAANMVQGLSSGLGGSAIDVFSGVQTFRGVPSSITATVYDAATKRGWRGTEVAGASAYDAATVSGSARITPAGTIYYAFYANGSCTGTPASVQTATLDSNGSAPVSKNTAALAAGSYSFRAAYLGGSSYRPATGGCQQFAVKPAPVVVRYNGPSAARKGKPVTLSGMLLSSARQAIIGRALTIVVGSGTHTQSCMTGKTKSKGIATCRIAKVKLTVGRYPVTVSFAGDPAGAGYYYAPGTGKGNIKIKA